MDITFAPKKYKRPEFRKFSADINKKIQNGQISRGRACFVSSTLGKSAKAHHCFKGLKEQPLRFKHATRKFYRHPG